MKGMISMNKMYPCAYYYKMPTFNHSSMCNLCKMYSYPCIINPMPYNWNLPNNYINKCEPYANGLMDDSINLKDYGPEPFVINIEEATTQNDTFRTALWTGRHLQLTLMSIEPGEDIGLEVHPHLDQFIRIEEGEGLIKMGDKKNRLNFQEKVYDDYALIIPAGKWHNLINTGDKPLKLYSIYAPPQHPKGTVHETKEIAEAAENDRD